MSTQKFRITISAENISAILSLAKKHSSSVESLPLIKAFEQYEWKVSREILKPSYTTAPTQAQRMELAPPAVTHRKFTDEELYNKWEGDSSTCTLKELERIMAYRYSMDMMDTEEEREYEKSVGLNF